MGKGKSRREIELAAATARTARRGQFVRKAAVGGLLACAVLPLSVAVLRDTVFAPEEVPPVRNIQRSVPVVKREPGKTAPVKERAGVEQGLWALPEGRDAARPEDITNLALVMAVKKVSAPLRKELESILLAHPGRDSRAAMLVALGKADCQVQCHLAKAVCRARPPWAASFLGEILKSPRCEDRTRRAVLREMRRSRLFATGIIDNLEAYLASRNCAVAVEATGIVGQFGLDEYCAKLVELLEHDDECVRQAALKSLREVSGRELSGDAQSWTDWISRQEELDRLDGQKCLQDLCSQNVARVVSAARKLSFSRLGRKQTAPALAALLSDGSVQVRRTASRALAQLNSFHAAPGLVEALSDEDSEVRSCAHKGLVRLSGLKMPAKVEAWKRWLGSG